MRQVFAAMAQSGLTGDPRNLRHMEKHAEATSGKGASARVRVAPSPAAERVWGGLFIGQKLAITWN